MKEYLRVCRIDHWLKNVFIVFGHAVAFVLVPEVVFSSKMLCAALFSLLPACFIASANYILNEILDAPFDRLHPTKKYRGVAAGKVSIPILWGVMGLLILVGFGLAIFYFNMGYVIALSLLLLSGFVYNVSPIRLKDRVYLDVIAESFNNPIRLWLGWYALVPFHGMFTPLSIVLAWWFFGALLMTGKRYAEYRFIGNDALSGRYRKSFETYSENRLIMAMITYANLFCFSTGLALASYPKLSNLVFVFPVIVIAIIAYFYHAMSVEGAKLEPEKLLKKPVLLLAIAVTILLSAWLLNSDADLVSSFRSLLPKL